jgi:hypothetical protein
MSRGRSCVGSAGGIAQKLVFAQDGAIRFDADEIAAVESSSREVMKSSRAIALAAGALFLVAGALQANSAKATFAGGCFWCMEAEFEKLPGVASVTSGYAGGSVKNPAYEQVSSGGTGHAESVEVVFDPSKITYEKLVEVYWENIDPLTENGQGLYRKGCGRDELLEQIWGVTPVEAKGKP